MIFFTFEQWLTQAEKLFDPKHQQTGISLAVRRTIPWWWKTVASIGSVTGLLCGRDLVPPPPELWHDE